MAAILGPLSYTRQYLVALNTIQDVCVRPKSPQACPNLTKLSMKSLMSNELMYNGILYVHQA